MHNHCCYSCYTLEECVFDDLLATNNYVYCYRKDYVLPRGMANSWVKGYEITQIPIN